MNYKYDTSNLKKTNKRKGWDEYFMDIAYLISTRATCDRKHVGALIVKDRRILTTGYNGSIAAGEHCNEVGHLMVDGHCLRTIHAEVNAIAQAAKYGIAIDESTIYVTAQPCFKCFNIIANSGISKVIYAEPYGLFNPDMDKVISDSKIEISMI